MTPSAASGSGPERLGVVSAFDAARGLGTVTADDGTEFGFHCVAIADGTRRVLVGSRVRFVLRPAHLGCYEADRITVV